MRSRQVHVAAAAAEALPMRALAAPPQCVDPTVPGHQVRVQGDLALAGYQMRVQGGLALAGAGAGPSRRLGYPERT